MKLFCFSRKECVVKVFRCEGICVGAATTSVL